MTVKRASRKSKPPELKVVFDTNALWNGSASDLLRLEVAELIRSNSRHSDLALTWYLPEVVRHERQFQMLKRAFELLSPIRKLERLLGHNLNITEEIIEQKVNTVIEQQVQDLGLKILLLDKTKVDWKAVMLDSAYRRPPFDPGEKEKGFRDALVAAAFLQLVAESLVTPKVCRVALITDDVLLTAAVSARTAGATNVRILGTLEDLKGLINTLASDVTEEFIQRVIPNASAYFFEAGKEDALFYREKIRGQILQRFADELQAVPEGASSRENEGWLISVPRFVEKRRQRIFWATRITVPAKAYRSNITYQIGNPAPSRLIELDAPNTGLLGLGLTEHTTIPLTKAGSIFNLSPQPQATQKPAEQEQTNPFGFQVVNAQPVYVSTPTRSLVAAGSSVFEVIWSVSATTAGGLSAPKIESISHVETTWE